MEIIVRDIRFVALEEMAHEENEWYSVVAQWIEKDMVHWSGKLELHIFKIAQNLCSTSSTSLFHTTFATRYIMDCV